VGTTLLRKLLLIFKKIIDLFVGLLGSVNDSKALIARYDPHITFLLNVFTCYCLLHNLLCIERDLQVERLMCIFERQRDNTQQIQH
jgi:hypothetical protein